MCASNVQAPLPPSALRRPDSAAAGAADDPATPRPSSACSPSPKRVSFALPPAAESRLAAAAALLHVAADGSASPVRRPSRLAATAALDAAAEFLSFMPDVDLPGQAPLAPLTVPSLASARRWPSNNALLASNDEIASAVDMSDVPLSPSTPAPAGTTLAQAILALLPQQRAQGEGQPGGEAAEEAGAADGLPAGRREAAGPSAAVHDASTGWRGWLGGLLCRLSWAAATSGSSIAELTQASAGGGGLTAGSRTSSVETFTSARSSSSDLFGSACSDDDLP